MKLQIAAIFSVRSKPTLHEVFELGGVYGFAVQRVLGLLRIQRELVNSGALGRRGKPGTAMPRRIVVGGVEVGALSGLAEIGHG